MPNQTVTNRHAAFTLVELLVVIAIVGVLMALLLPAMNKARARAKLLQCLARERMLGVHVLSYVADFKQAYPYREVSMVSNNAPYLLTSLLAPAKDDRPMFKTFLDLDRDLICPLAPLPAGVSLGRTITNEAWSSYALWFGAQISMAQPASAMLRAGDRPVYTAGGVTSTFNILASDMERDWNGYGGVYWLNSAHPDEGNVLFQDRAWYDPAYTISTWRQQYANAAGMTRGPMDQNFLFDDGSAKTLRHQFRDPSTVAVQALPDSAALGDVVSIWLPPMK